MSIGCEKSYRPHCETCPSLGFQDVSVCVPVEVKPFAEVGRIKTECLGKPTIHRGMGCGHHEGKTRDVCRFAISQKIRVEVPVAFGAKTEVGEARIDCRDCDRTITAPRLDCDCEYTEHERKCI